MRTKNILLIEDDYVDVTSVKRALAKLNVKHTLHVAHNGVDALNILNGDSEAGARVLPDIILLDLNMPKMNGLEFLGIMKNYYSLKNIKVFVMTTSAEEYDLVATQQLGVDGYILKPLDFENTRKGPHAAAVNQLKQELLGNDLKTPLLLFAPGTLHVSLGIKAKLLALKKAGLLSFQYLVGAKTLTIAAVAVSSVAVTVKQALEQRPANAPAVANREFKKPAGKAAGVTAVPVVISQPVVAVENKPTGKKQRQEPVHEEPVSLPGPTVLEEADHARTIIIMALPADEGSGEAVPATEERQSPVPGG